MAHAASQLKKKADENLNAAEDEKEKKKTARKRSRELKKKVEKEEDRAGMRADTGERERERLVGSSGVSFVMMQPPHTHMHMHTQCDKRGGPSGGTWRGRGGVKKTEKDG